MEVFHIKTNKMGQLVIPKEYVNKLVPPASDCAVVFADHNGLRVLSQQQAIFRAQCIMKKYLNSNEGMSEDLVKDRRGVDY